MTDEVHYREMLARFVLRYLLEHPNAADTIEGVKLWWLRDDVHEISQTVLQTVLDELSQRGWLVMRGNQPETRTYSLNERARDEVERFVAETDEPGEALHG